MDRQEGGRWTERWKAANKNSSAQIKIYVKLLQTLQEARQLERCLCLVYRFMTCSLQYSQTWSVFASGMIQWQSIKTGNNCLTHKQYN